MQYNKKWGCLCTYVPPFQASQWISDLYHCTPNSAPLSDKNPELVSHSRNALLPWLIVIIYITWLQILALSSAKLPSHGGRSCWLSLSSSSIELTREFACDNCLGDGKVPKNLLYLPLHPLTHSNGLHEWDRQHQDGWEIQTQMYVRSSGCFASHNNKIR